MANVIDGAGNGGNKNIFDDINKKLKEYAQKSGNTTRNKMSDNSYSKALENKSMASNSYSKATQKNFVNNTASSPMNTGINTQTSKTQNVQKGNLADNVNKVVNDSINSISNEDRQKVYNDRAERKTKFDTFTTLAMALTGKMLDSKYHTSEVVKPINKVITEVDNVVTQGYEDEVTRSFDKQFEDVTNLDAIKAKLEVFPDYRGRLYDENGNLRDYTEEIETLQNKLNGAVDKTEIKTYKKQLEAAQARQNDVERLTAQGGLQYLEENGASQEVLNDYKKAIVRGEFDFAQRLVNNFGGTLEGAVGSFAKGVDTLYWKTQLLLGGDYNYNGSKLAERIIDDSQQLQQITVENAGAFEGLVYQTYDGMAPFLYSLLTANTIAGGVQTLGNYAAAKELVGNALYLSDIQVLGQTMYENEKNGFDKSTAFNNAIQKAAASHITESIGGETIANILTGEVGGQLVANTWDYLTRTGVNAFASEFFEEYAESGLDFLVDATTINKELTVKDFFDELTSEDTLYEALIGGLGGLVMGEVSAIKTTKTYNSMVKSLSDFEINTKKDYNAATEASKMIDNVLEKSKVKIDEKKAKGLDTTIDENQLFELTALNGAFKKKIAEYVEKNPYANAINKEGDNIEVTGDPNYDKSVINDARPTFFNEFKSLTEMKTMLEEQGEKAITLLSEKLQNDGVNISQSELSKLSKDEIDELMVTSAYAKSLNRSNVMFANITDKNGDIIDGVHDDNTNTIVVNPHSKRGALSTLIHEYTHGTEASKYYDYLDILTDEFYGDKLDDAIKQLKDNYASTIKLTDDGAKRELVALTTQNLLGNQDYVDRLVRYNNSLAYQMYEEIKFVNEKTNTAQDIEQNFLRAFKDIKQQTTNDVEYSISDKSIQKELDKLGITQDSKIFDFLRDIKQDTNLDNRIAKGLEYKQNNPNDLAVVTKILDANIEAWNKGFDTYEDLKDYQNSIKSMSDEELYSELSSLKDTKLDNSKKSIVEDVLKVNEDKNDYKVARKTTKNIAKDLQIQFLPNYDSEQSEIEMSIVDLRRELREKGNPTTQTISKLHDAIYNAQWYSVIETEDSTKYELKKFLNNNPINTTEIKRNYGKGDVKSYMDDLRKAGFTFKNGQGSAMDIVLKDIGEQFGIIDPNETDLLGAVETVKDYVLSPDYEKHVDDVPAEYEAKMEKETIAKVNDVIGKMSYEMGIDNLASQEYQSKTISKTHTKEDFNKLTNNEKALQEMAEQAASANLTDDALDLFEEQSLQQLMEDIDADKVKESTVGKVLQEVKKDEPLSNNKKVWDKIKTAIVDKGQVIYDMAREYKSDTLVPLYDMFLQHKNVANNELTNQITDEKGKKVGKSLLEISKQIPEEERTDFDMYMYHLLNIDTNKYHKNVFDGVSADESQSLVSQYELQHPEWKRVRDDYYKYAKHLRDTLVEHGRISKQTAELWEKMYPHYVPISRVLDTEVDTEGLPQTEDIKVQSTNKGTVNERTGGKSALQPLDYALAEQTRKTYKSSFLNDFAKEYVRTTNAPATQFDLQLDVDNVIDSLSGEVKAADENVPAQLIWYDDGDLRVTEISNELYNAISSDKQYNLPESKTLQKLNNLKRNLITGHNPLFALTNTIKDAQDIIYNSKHALKTYAMLPRAWYHLAANSDVAQLYKKYGGEYSTITSESFKDTPNKLYNNTIGKIESFNNFFEMAPRLAEFMASLEEGKSPQQAMYDAQEVTTNFKRGGEVSKWADRNGATFLNASIQGFDKQVRNYQESYDRNGVKGVLSRMAKSTLISSIPLLILNHLIWKDDDDYEELSDYVKDNYYIVGKYDDGKFIRIPKGRVAAAYQSIITGLYENGQELINDDSLTEKASKMWDNSIDSLLNVWDNIGVNNPLQNNLISPIIQVANNESWYGDPIVSEYMAQKENAEQYDESTDKFSVWLGSVTNQSPKMINYLLNQYSGGIGDVVLPMLTPKAETDLDDGTIAGKLKSAALSPMLDKFTVDSVIKNQRISDIYTLSEELTAQSKKDNASDEVKIANKYINSIKYQMNSVNSQIKAIYNNENLSDAEKYEQARTLQKQRVELAKIGLNSYDQLDIDGTYATVNGITYSKNSENEWTKASDTKVSEYSFFGNSKQLEEFNAIESKKDSNGKTITNSKSLEKRKYLMDNGLWSDYVNNVGIDNTSTYGVSKSVYNMTDAEFKAAYNSLVSGTYKTTKTSSASGSSTKLSNKQKQAMLKYMSAIRSGENDLFTMIKNSTSIEDAKKNVEKILNKYQKS